MAIRKWNLGDLFAIHKLMTQLLESSGEKNKFCIKSMATHFLEMLNFPDIYQSYVYELDRKIIGFISIIYYRSIIHNKGTALINELVIDQEYRKYGYGEQLIKFAMKRASDNGMDEIEVGVKKSNINAIQFYKSMEIREEYLLLGKEFINESFVPRPPGVGTKKKQ